MAIATGLISSLFMSLRPETCLTAAAPMLASWLYQSLPLLSFAIHSFLPYHVNEKLRCTRYGFGAILKKVQRYQGHLLRYSLLGLLPKGFKLAGSEAQ